MSKKNKNNKIGVEYLFYEKCKCMMAYGNMFASMVPTLKCLNIIYYTLFTLKVNGVSNILTWGK